jgi:3',5'-cyclic AMP phosphodiesterase CpdA
MKKLISIILSVAMLISVAGITASAEYGDCDLSFAVASDLHINVDETELEWYSEDPIFGYANRRAAMEHESEFIIDEFLNQCANDDNIQFVLISGDLADNGRSIPEEHYTVAEKLTKFEKETGKQVYVIPGNHDFGNLGEYCEVDLAKFKEIYADFGYNQALTLAEGHGSYTADLSERYRLIALDSNDPDKSTEDGVTEDRVEWVVEQAKKAYADNKYPILMMHHNLLDHLPMQRILSHNFIIRNHTATAEKWANAGIRLVFTGHEHCSDATSYTSAKGNLIYDFATTSLTMYPLQYRYIEMYDNEIRYEAKTVDKIDTDALTQKVPDYSQEQIDAMNAGLNAYAENFLKAGVQYRLELGFTDEKLGIKEDDIYYDLVRDVIDALVDVLDMPLYGEGSLSEVAAEYNITLPESEYETGWDLAMTMVAAHYAGSENYPMSGRDVTLFLRIVSTVIKEVVGTLDDTVISDIAVAILAGVGNDQSYDVIEKITNEQGGITAGEYLALAIFSPVIESFVVDDGVDDNNGSIVGYARNSDGDRLDNIAGNLSSGFSEFTSMINTILQFLMRVISIWEGLGIQF